MFGAARLQRIKDIISEKKQVDVSTLSSMLSVTEVTIRRDLEKLEEEGFITKTHGGAILNEMPSGSITSNNTSTILPSDVVYDDSKKLIGEIAAYHIKENESIFLGGGTTCHCVALALRDKKRINVVTNNMNAAYALAGNSSINVILTGGNLLSDTMALTGEIVLKSLEDIFIDKAIISVSGVHLDHGFTLSNLMELNVYKAIVNISKELVIVADHTKFNKVSFSKLGNLSIAKKVITNENVPDEYKAYFFQRGIQIFTSYKIED